MTSILNCNLITCKARLLLILCSLLVFLEDLQPKAAEGRELYIFVLIKEENLVFSQDIVSLPDD